MSLTIMFAVVKCTKHLSSPPKRTKVRITSLPVTGDRWQFPIALMVTPLDLLRPPLQVPGAWLLVFLPHHVAGPSSYGACRFKHAYASRTSWKKGDHTTLMNNRKALHTRRPLTDWMDEWVSRPTTPSHHTKSKCLMYRNKKVTENQSKNSIATNWLRQYECGNNILFDLLPLFGLRDIIRNSFRFPSNTFQSFE